MVIPAPFTIDCPWPLLTTASPGYPTPVSFHPTSFTIGPFTYRARITLGPGSGVDDYLFVNGVSVRPDLPASSALPEGTVLAENLLPGQTLLLQGRNTAGPEAGGYVSVVVTPYVGTSISFPTGLPIPLRDTYSETFEQIHRSLDMEVGTARRRARMRTAPRRFSLSFVFSQSEFTTFDSWWQNSILGGEKQFDIQLLDEDDADPLAWYTVRVTDGEYSLNVTQSFDYEVSFSVRALSDGFLGREAGTNTLRGYNTMGMRALPGNLLVFTPFRGAATLGITYARAVSNLSPLRGGASFYMLAKARFTVTPLGGSSALTLTVTGRFDDAVLVSYPEQSRQWQQFGWMRPLAAQDVNISQELVSREFSEI